MKKRELLFKITKNDFDISWFSGKGNGGHAEAIVDDDGYLKLNQIKPAGKRTMSAIDFINGMPNKEQVYQVQGN